VSTSPTPHDRFPDRLENDVEHAGEWLDEQVVEVRRTMHRDVKIEMRWLILALIAALGIGLAFGFGQGRSSYSKSGASFAAIEHSLTGQGLRICDRQSVDVTRVRGVQQAETLLLGYHSCPSTTNGDVNRLSAYQFSSSETRDAAARGSLGTRGAVTRGSVWTYGPYLIVMSNQGSDMVTQLAHNALRDIGAD
jgi:hypothetical protein